MAGWIQKILKVKPELDKAAAAKIKADVERPFEGINKNFGGIKAFFAGAAVASAIAIIMKGVGEIRESFKDGADTLLKVVDRLDQVQQRSEFYGADTATLGQLGSVAKAKGVSQGQFYMLLDKFQDTLNTAREQDPNSVAGYSSDTLTAFRQWQASLAGMTDIAARNAEITRVMGIKLAGNSADFLTANLTDISKQIGPGLTNKQYQANANIQDQIDIARVRMENKQNVAVAGLAQTRFGAALMPEQKQIERSITDVANLSTSVRVEELFIDLNNSIKDLSLAIGSAAVGFNDAVKKSSDEWMKAIEQIKKNRENNRIQNNQGVLP